jgi:hypothetical protein
MNPTLINGNIYQDSNFQGSAYAGPTGLQALLPDMVTHIAGAFTAACNDSLPIANGPVSITITPNRPFIPGGTVRLQRIADPTCFLRGEISAYTPSTGAMDLQVVETSVGTGGLGPYSDWQILAFGLAGSPGTPGPVFNGGVISNTLSANNTAINESAASLPSATVMNIGAAAGNYVTVSGTTTISSFDVAQAGARRTLVFLARLTITHNASSLILPNAINAITAPGDSYTFESEGGGNWRCVASSVARPVFKQAGSVRAHPSISSGTLSLDLQTAGIFDVDLNANITSFQLLNPLPSDIENSFVLVFTCDGTARSVAWPSSVKWGMSGAPSLSSTAGKQDVFVFTTRDGGTSYLGFVSGQSF